jgi:hypothetical protein
MRLIRIGEQKHCTFCAMSQQAARWLIASPDQSTYICDKCTVMPSKLMLAGEEREAQREVPSSSSRARRFLEKHLHTKRLRCSFCRNRASLNKFICTGTRLRNSGANLRRLPDRLSSDSQGRR